MNKQNQSIIELLPEILKALKSMPNSPLASEIFQDTRALATALECASVPDKIAVTLEGGLVTAIVSDDEHPIDVYVLDYDTEGASDDETYEVPQGDGSISEACIQGSAVRKATIDLTAVIHNFENNISVAGQVIDL